MFICAQIYGATGKGQKKMCIRDRYVSDDFEGTHVLGPKAIVVASTFDANYDNISGSYSVSYTHLMLCKSCTFTLAQQHGGTSTLI